ncbi:UTRA domain-containing protein [Streptomyces sp. NPDC054840]
MGKGRWVGSSSLYLRPGGDAWKQEAAAQGGTGGQRIAYAGEAIPPPDVAAVLRTPDGESAIVRRRVILLNDRPIEIADSYWPRDIAGDSALAEPGRIRGGAVALLAELGWTPAEVTEAVTARPPFPEETETLELNADEWVLVLTRVITNDEGRPYEATVMVAPGSTRQLNYSMKVD